MSKLLRFRHSVARAYVASLVGFAGWLLTPVAQAIPIPAYQNGGFENNSSDGSSVLEGWELTGTGTNQLSSSVPRVAGDFALVFNVGPTAPGGTLAQTFRTQPGGTYQVQFSFGALHGGSSSVSQLQVEVRDGASTTDGTQLLNHGSATIDGASGGTLTVHRRILQVRDASGVIVPESGPLEEPVYNVVQFSFTALSDTCTLVFTDQSTAAASAQDLVLDEVGVTPGPVEISSLASLMGTAGSAPGSYPFYGQLLKASDGNLYGTTSSGGAANAGVIFKIDAANRYSVVAQLPGVPGPGTPYGGLIQGSDGNFYGTSYSGGVHNYGSVFRMTPAGVVTTLHSFSGSDGYAPWCAPTEGPGGTIYGVTTYGGSQGIGTAFKLTPEGVFSVLANFDNILGAYPISTLLLAPDGSFYAPTYSGGDNGTGTIFKIAPDDTVSKIANFAPLVGGYPYAPLVLGANNVMYGAASSFGQNGGGTVYQVTPGGELTVLASPTAEQGQTIYGGLSLAGDGTLYGVTTYGAAHGAGGLFALSPSGEWRLLASNPTNSSAYGGVTERAPGELFGSYYTTAENANGAIFTTAVARVRVSLPAITGEPLDRPGLAESGVPAGATWRTFGIPGLDSGAGGLSDGAPVFRATFGSSAGSLYQGVFGLGGPTPLLAKTGDVAPGTNGATFTTFADPAGNSGTAFIAALQRGPLANAANDRGLWTNIGTDASEPLRLVAREGTPVLGLSGATWKQLSGLAVNDGGNLIWTALLGGVPAAQAKAVFGQASFEGGPQLLLRTGMSIAGAGTVVNFSHPWTKPLPLVANYYGTGRTNGGSITPVLLYLNGGRQAVATIGLGQSPQILALTGELVPQSLGLPGALWQKLREPSASPTGQIAFYALLKQGATPPVVNAAEAAAPPTGVTAKNRIALIRKAPDGDLSLLARADDQAPDAGDARYVDFTDPVLNSDGDALFFASLAQPTGRSAGSGLFWRAAGASAATLAARTGMEVSGLPGVRFAKFLGAVLPSNASGLDGAGGPVFTALLANATAAGGVKAANNVGLFAIDAAGAVRLLARTGSLYEGKTIRSIDAFSYVLGSVSQARAASSARSVLFRATFTDRRSSAIIRVPIPAPVPE